MLIGCVLAGCTGTAGIAASTLDAGVDAGFDDAGLVDAGSDAGLPATPAWLRGVPLNRWVEIPGTILAGSPGAPGEDPLDPYAMSNRSIGAYSGMAMRDDTAELFVAAAGGHGDSSDNSVRSIALLADAPAWQLRSSASAQSDRLPDVAYYLDGKPTSRHTYWSTQWSRTRGRVMLHRTRFSYGSAVSFDDSNGFDPATNRWDPDNTWADGKTAQCHDADDNVWAMAGTSLFKWVAATDTWALTRDFRGDSFPYGPLAFDPVRQQLFTLAWGDGQGYGTGVTAFVVANEGTTRTPVSFDSGPGLTSFMAEQPAYAALDYDPGADHFLFFAAQAGALDHVYVVTPKASGPWALELLALDPSSVVPVTAGGGGLMNKFQYVSTLGGFVLFTSAVKPVYFLRTK